MKIISELDDIKVTLIGPIMRSILTNEYPSREFGEADCIASKIIPLSIHTDIGSAIVYTSIINGERSIYTFGNINVFEDASELDKEENLPVLKIRRN